MTVRRITTWVLGTTALLAAVPAAAQTVPDLRDITTQSELLNRDAELAASNRVRAEEQQDGTIDGEAGVYVLVVNEIFQLSASGGLGYTDNPVRTADDLGGSGFGEFSLAAGVATQVGGLVDVGLAANVGGREFFEDNGPSSRTASASLSAGLPVVGPVYLSAAAFGGYSFDNEFESPTGFYGLSANLSAAFPITQSLLIRPGLGVTRQWAEVSENDSTLVAASIDAIQALGPDLTASLRGSVVRRWYDDFYEDVTFIPRRDTSYGISAALAYRLGSSVAIAATVSYERQDSRFFLAEFDAFEGTAGISAQLRF